MVPLIILHVHSTGLSLLTVIWTVIAADLWVRYIIVAAKAFVSAVPVNSVKWFKSAAGGAAAASSSGNSSYSPVSQSAAGAFCVSGLIVDIVS